MYIQPQGTEPPLRVPSGYGGNTFAPPAPAEPPAENAFCEAPRGNFPPPPQTPPREDLPPREPPFCEPPPPEPPRGGLFGRFPFLAGLMPPPRRGQGHDKEQDLSLRDLAILGAALLLFLDDKTDDVLPLLLLLLLWD